MKYLVILLGLCLFSCNNQTASNIQPEIEIENGSLTKGEQDSLIMVLSPYLEIDSIMMQDANQTLQMVSKALGDANGENDYYQNISHVDSIIHQCIAYAKQNEPKQLLDLFDKGKVNIYAHPSNTIEHEKGLHYMILSLYEKYYRPVSERLYAEKMIELYELTFLHIIGLETFGGYFHPDYIPLAKVLIDCYADGLNNYDKAIELQKKVCMRVEQEDANGRYGKWYLLEMVNLSMLYDAISDRFHLDSCYQIYVENPYYEKYMVNGEFDDE